MHPILKPCPFCGGKARWIPPYWYDGNQIGDEVVCTKCGVTMPPPRMIKQPNAIQAWNSRVIITNLTDLKLQATVIDYLNTKP